MIVKNKKNGTNVLSYKTGAKVAKVIITGGKQVDIPSLENFNQIVNKADFTKRGWFEIVSKLEEKESIWEKAKREVGKYTKEKEEDIK